MKYKILLVVFSFCLIISALLSSVSTSTLCGLEQNGCNTVNNSPYSKTFGIPNSSLGILVYTLMILLVIWHMRRPNDLARKMILAGTSIIGIFAIYFIYLQFFVINAICKYCIAVDLFSLLAMVFVFLYAE